MLVIGDPSALDKMLGMCLTKLSILLWKLKKLSWFLCKLKGAFHRWGLQVGRWAREVKEVSLVICLDLKFLKSQRSFLVGSSSYLGIHSKITWGIYSKYSLHTPTKFEFPRMRPRYDYLKTVSKRFWSKPWIRALAVDYWEICCLKVYESLLLSKDF